MRLEDLYPNFGKSLPEEQQLILAAYRLRRAQDLERISTADRKRATGARSKFDLSEEEKKLMKKLGLKQKDVLALRAVVDDTEEDSGVELFKDELFEEEEEK
jgi:DNA-directed RNA polymerase subunit H (RpoH/RPB5)